MASPGRGPVPVTRPRGVLAFLVPLLVAAGAGLALGLAPRAALAVEAGLLSALVLVVRLEWAALVVIGTAVFEDYLDLRKGRAVTISPPEGRRLVVLAHDGKDDRLTRRLEHRCAVARLAHADEGELL